MKVVFVLPPFDMSRSLGSKKRMQRGFLPSLGIGYVAASVESYGHSTALIDAQVQNLDYTETVDQVLESDPDVVGISVMSIYAHAAYLVACELKERNPNLTIIMGGPHTTSFYNDILDECPSVDIVVPGEGETVFTEVVQRISRKEPYQDVPGILFRNGNGETVMTQRAPVVEDLDALPHVSRHLFDPYPYKPLANQVR
ncbi:MAG: cobalamin-dependent protein, partial [Candidatus Hydrogenedentota bacterium]